MDLPVYIKRRDASIPLPEYKTSGAVGFDIAVSESVTLAPGERRLVETGLVVCVPKGYVLLITSRSSSAKKGVMLGNGVGTIDPDFCGPNDELRLPLYNFGNTPYTIEKGERFAQGLFVPVSRAVFTETETLETPNRGGFGTTG